MQPIRRKNKNCGTEFRIVKSYHNALETWYAELQATELLNDICSLIFLELVEISHKKPGAILGAKIELPIIAASW